MEAIINANYSNKVTSTTVLSSFKNVKLTALFLGQKLHENVNWNFMEGYSFEGRLADVNIWDWELQEDHVGKWYRGTGRDERPRVAWNRLGYPSKRFGDVHLVTITSAFFGRGMSRKKKKSALNWARKNVEPLVEMSQKAMMWWVHLGKVFAFESRSTRVSPRRRFQVACLKEICCIKSLSYSTFSAMSGQ